jgi:hypothetical protein
MASNLELPWSNLYDGRVRYTTLSQPIEMVQQDIAMNRASQREQNRA